MKYEHFYYVNQMYQSVQTPQFQSGIAGKSPWQDSGGVSYHLTSTNLTPFMLYFFQDISASLAMKKDDDYFPTHSTLALEN